MENNNDHVEHLISGTIDRFENTFAVILTDDKNEIHWPIKKLPDNCQEGAVVKLKIITDKSEQAHREEMAKTILNKILKKEKGNGK